MSRSFKKGYYESICSNKGDKKYRALYHRQNRAKNRPLVKSIENTFNQTGNIDPAESNFIKNGVDYSLKSSDKWSWPSDGGTYYFGSLESLQAEFDIEVFGICPHRYSSYRNIWERYLLNKSILENKQGSLYKGDWFDRLFLEEEIPLNLKNSQDLINWLIPRQRDILKTMYKKYIRK